MKAKVIILTDHQEVKYLADTLIKEYKANASKEIRIAIKNPKSYKY